MSATSNGWRPIHRRLPDEHVQNELYAPESVHLGLVTDQQHQQFRTACGQGLGQWMTGAGEQVTCPGCLETVHA